MDTTELMMKISEIVARACDMYVECPIEKERFVGAALQVLCLLEKQK